MTRTLFALALSAAIPVTARADSDHHGPMMFDPIEGSAYVLSTDPAILESAPWVLPKGYRQSIVSDETRLDLYVAHDWSDMNAINESGKHAGAYMYRTHEVRPGNDQRNDGAVGGAVSVIDLKTGATKELVTRTDWEGLDGIVWTPWHTLLVAEETVTSAYPDPEVPQATSGLLYEIALNSEDPTIAHKISVRPKLGALSHEGIETDADGNVYVIDEDRKGSVYKFIPDHYGDLNHGQLYALKVDNGGKTGSASWVALDMTQAQISARVAARAVNATAYCRPEDMERIQQTLYVALTCEDVTNPTNAGGAGAVLAVTLGDKPVAKFFVAPGVNVGREDKSAGVTGLRNPDNLANGPDGTLWIVEDNIPSDIWVATPDRDGDGYSDDVALFASLKDAEAEGTGITFGADPYTLYVNVQHSVTGNDKTMAITNRDAP